MIWTGTLFEPAAWLGTGVVVCFLALWWRQWNLKQFSSLLARLVESEKSLQERQQKLKEHDEALNQREHHIQELEHQARKQLEAFSGFSEEQARMALLEKVEQKTLSEANALARRIIEEARTRAEEKAKYIVSVAIQRYAGRHTFENTTTAISLQGDEIKGRIIGREGRNIRAFEAATGITVLIEDDPGAVLLSGFDPVRREVAREAMARLIADGRIHPTRIEEVVAEVNAEIESSLLHHGEDAVQETGLPPMNPEIVKVLGRLHFRHSFAQNLLNHSIEVSHLTGLMAAELGLDISVAKRAGLLHDIGKALSHEYEGPHALVGANLLKRCGEPDNVVNAVASHHNDVAPSGPFGFLVSAADAISASRPGARSETMTTFLKRMEDLEKLAANLPGVEKVYAVQAGRELRVFVRPDELDDHGALDLARSVASKIENQMQYPGQIKVTVIRETRCVEVAK